MKCPECDCEDIYRLAWIDDKNDFVDYFYDEVNPYYMGDDVIINTCSCSECGHEFNDNNDE